MARRAARRLGPYADLPHIGLMYAEVYELDNGRSVCDAGCVRRARHSPVSLPRPQRFAPFQDRFVSPT